MTLRSSVTVATVALSLACGSTQAVAAACWSQAAVEAAQVRDFETGLMVATLRLTQPEDG